MWNLKTINKHLKQNNLVNTENRLVVTRGKVVGEKWMEGLKILKTNIKTKFVDFSVTNANFQSFSVLQG